MGAEILYFGIKYQHDNICVPHLLESRYIVSVQNASYTSLVDDAV